MVSAQEFGQFIIKYSDQNESAPETVYSKSTQIISGGALAAPTSTTLMAIPYTGPQNRVARGRVGVYFKSFATDIIESEESQFEIPGVYLDEKTLKPVSSVTLTQENMTGFTQAGTVDKTATLNEEVKLCHFDVPRGLVFMLDATGKVRAYIGDDTA